MKRRHTSEQYQALKNIGVDDAQINGFEVVGAEEYCLKEYYSNRLQQGLDVPEEYIPQNKTRKENEISYQEMMMYNLEGERVNRKPSGFPDPYMWYEEDELMYDPALKEERPIWMVERDERNRKKEERILRWMRKKHIVGRREILAKKLKEMKFKKELDSKLVMIQRNIEAIKVFKARQKVKV